MSSKEYFDEVAPRWDLMRREFFPETVRERAYAVAGLQPGRVALDVGAGTGFISEGLIHRGVRVIALDESQAMLAEMQRRFPPGAGIEYRLGDAQQLPLQDAAVDYVFANMCLHHVESPPAAIREMHRVLKPGGRLVVTDLDAHAFEFLRTEHHDRWLGFRRDELRRWLIEAGFHSVLVDSAGEHCCAQSQCSSTSAAISIFVARGEK